MIANTDPKHDLHHRHRDNFNRNHPRRLAQSSIGPTVRSRKRFRCYTKPICQSTSLSFRFHNLTSQISILSLFFIIIIGFMIVDFHPISDNAIFIKPSLAFHFQSPPALSSDNSSFLRDAIINNPPTPPITTPLPTTEVTSSPSGAGANKPYLLMSPKNVTAINRSAAILICEVKNDNSEKPKFEWFKDGQSLKSVKRIGNIKYKQWSVLRLEPLKAERDQGIYSCRVDTESTDHSLQSEINVKIINQTDAKEGFPIITQQPVAQQTVELNGTAILNCHADADPQPEYNWLHNLLPLGSDGGKWSMSNDGTLRINNVTDSDKGDYLCVITNSKGYVLSTLSFLSVSLEPIQDNPPTDLKYKQTSPTDVTISWQHPTTKNNYTITSYEIYFAKSGSTNHSKHDIPFTNRIAFNDLSENTEYTFRIRPKSSSGFGTYAHPLTFRTPKDSPPPPNNVKALGTSYSTAMIWWDEIAYFDGITGYRIYYNMSSNQPTMKIDYDKWLTKDITLTNSVTITNLVKDEFYEVRVGLIGQNITGKLSSPIKFRSAPIEVPYDLKVAEVTTHSAKLMWKQPLEMVPNRYIIVYDAPEKHFLDSQGKLTSSSLSPTTLNTTNTSIDVIELQPYTRYRFNVTAMPRSESFRPPITVSFTTHMAAPKQMGAPILLGKTANPREFELFLPRASEEYGPIGFYYVIVLPFSQSSGRPMNPDNYLTTDLKNSKTEKSPYITAKFSKSKMVQKFILGDNKTYEGFRNRELNLDMQYYVFVRAVVEQVESLFTSSVMSDPINLQTRIESLENPETSFTDSNRKFRIYILATLVIMVVLLGLLGTIFLRNQRQVLKTNQMNETTIRLLPERVIDRIYSSVPAEPQQLIERRNMNYQSRAMLNHPNVPVSELADHIEYLKMNNNLKDEYESIEPGQQFTWEHSYMDCNRPKNRYGNVVAYDHSRVTLCPILDANKQPVPGSDYINANYCDGYNSPNQYIATQGPLPNTVGDFWRMVWEQKTRTIVMMTQLEERGRVKCVQYWPSRDSVTYFGITVTGCVCVKQCVCVEELAYYTIRTIKLQFGNTIREVRQFQFTAWPDHGVPDHPTPFLMFLRRIKITNPADAGPVVVLCSAGVGRTGCYIVIDSMIERIKHDNTIDIYGHVTRLRAQRNYIVQTEDQYMFIHDAVMEAIITADTVVPIARLTEHLQKLLQSSTNEGATGLELEFKRLTSIRFVGQKFVSANLPVNKHKNRLMNILPYESTRVCLEPIAGIEGSDYINASFCDGYTQRNAYIATQSPLPETVNDLWRMVVEHNSGIIVMLTKLKEMGREKCTQYWPAERYGDYGPYRVTLNREYDTSTTYILREFTITDLRNPNYSRVIRQFHYMDWPEQGVPKSGDSFINFITDVHNTKQTIGIEGPITVLCSVGVGRTGVFIGLSITLERLRNESFLNLFETVRTLRTQRPGMVQTVDQYQFSYQTALEYLRKF